MDQPKWIDEWQPEIDRIRLFLGEPMIGPTLTDKQIQTCYDEAKSYVKRHLGDIPERACSVEVREILTRNLSLASATVLWHSIEETKYRKAGDVERCKQSRKAKNDAYNEQDRCYKEVVKKAYTYYSWMAHQLEVQLGID